MSVTRESTAAARVGFLTTGVTILVLWNAATALSLVPITAAGVPVLASGGVALLIGALWPGRDATEFPEVER
jgi:hypothetical protein